MVIKMIDAMIDTETTEATENLKCEQALTLLQDPNYIEACKDIMSKDRENGYCVFLQDGGVVVSEMITCYTHYVWDHEKCKMVKVSASKRKKRRKTTQASQ